MTLNINPCKIDSRSPCSGGATTSLCAQVDRDLVQLQGCWKSDAMMRHLHVSASPWVNKFAEQMFKAGSFTFPPEIHDDGAPTHDDPDPTDLPCNDPVPSGDNSHKDHSVDQPNQPSLLSPNLSPILPPSLSSSDQSNHAHTSLSRARPSFFSSVFKHSRDQKAKESEICLHHSD